MKKQLEIDLHELKSNLNRFAKNALADNLITSEWTYRIMEIFVKHGKDLNLEVCTKGQYTHKTFAEWLFDLVLYTPVKGDKNSRVRRINLILESEWSTIFSDILYDFEKIMVAKADMRVMIYQAKDKYELDRILHNLISSIEEYEQSSIGDKYVFIPYNTETQKFELIEYEFGRLY